MRILTTLLFLLCLNGCASLATYPPVENESFLSNPNSANEPVPTIFAEVLTYAHAHYGGMDIIVFNLPKGVTSETYNIVSRKLGGAVPMAVPNQIAYHITELRVRGLSAEADIIFPSSGGGYEEASIKLESSLFKNWVVTDERVWLIPSEIPPTPNNSTTENKED